MSRFENVLAETAQWLTIPGVETIIPNPSDNSIMVVISCSTLALSDSIPEHFKGYVVDLYCVPGLDLKPKKRFNFSFPSFKTLSKPV